MKVTHINLVDFSTVLAALVMVCACTPTETKQTNISPIATLQPDTPMRSPIARPPQEAARFAFSAAINGQSDIFIGDSDGKLVANLTNDPANDSCPTYSPDGAQIAFCSDRNGKSQLFLMESNGSGQKLLTDKLPDCSCTPDRPMAWSPDSKWISLASQTGQTDNMPKFDLFVVRSNGTKVSNLTNSPATIAGFSWSPESTAILFIDASKPDIFQVTVDNNKITSFVTAPMAGIPAGYSPDGSQLLIWDGQKGTISILSFATGMPEANQLTGGNGYNKYPAWSSDGQKIVYMSREGENNDIFMMNADGSGQINMTAGSGVANYWPSISPDGKKVVYLTMKGNQWDTMIMNADGSGKTKVTDVFGLIGSLSWQP